jgi:hypothetical protein
VRKYLILAGLCALASGCSEGMSTGHRMVYEPWNNYGDSRSNNQLVRAEQSADAASQQNDMLTRYRITPAYAQGFRAGFNEYAGHNGGGYAVAGTDPGNRSPSQVAGEDSTKPLYWRAGFRDGWAAAKNQTPSPYLIAIARATEKLQAAAEMSAERSIAEVPPFPPAPTLGVVIADRAMPSTASHNSQGPTTLSELPAASIDETAHGPTSAKLQTRIVLKVLPSAWTVSPSEGQKTSIAERKAAVPSPKGLPQAPKDKARSAKDDKAASERGTVLRFCVAEDRSPAIPTGNSPGPTGDSVIVVRFIIP